jgi:hypothetical protein
MSMVRHAGVIPGRAEPVDGLLHSADAIRELCSLLDQLNQLDLRLLDHDSHVEIVSVRSAQRCLSRGWFLIH